jgi:hypothetical protein
LGVDTVPAVRVFCDYRGNGATLDFRVRTVEQTFLRPGRYRVGGELRDYSAGILRAFRDGTRAVLAAGHSIPLFFAHKPLGAVDGGPVQDAGQATADTVGWLRGIDQTQDGALRATIDVTDPAAAEKIKNGSIRFTSPEMVPEYIDGHGREFKNVVRHMALTSIPRSPDQGDFAVAGAAQFSLDDFEGPIVTKKQTRKEREIERTIGGQFADDEKKKDAVEIKSDDAPPDDQGKDDESVIEEQGNDVEDTEGPDALSVVMQVIERLGVEIPDGVDPMSKAGLIVVMTAILNKNAPEDVDAAAVEEITPGVAQFAEHDDPVVRALAGKVMSLEADGIAEKTKTTRGKLLASIEGATIPPIAKKRLRALYAGAQFSDGEQAQQYTLGQVVDIVINAIPKSVQFDEKDAAEVETADHDEGAEFFDREKHTANPGGGVPETEEQAAAAEDVYNRGINGRWSGGGRRVWKNPNPEMGPAKAAEPAAAE